LHGGADAPLPGVLSAASSRVPRRGACKFDGTCRFPTESERHIKNEIKLMDIVHGGSITDHIRALLRLHMTSGSGAKAARGNPNAH